MLHSFSAELEELDPSPSAPFFFEACAELCALKAEANVVPIAFAAAVRTAKE